MMRIATRSADSFYTCMQVTSLDRPEPLTRILRLRVKSGLCHKGRDGTFVAARVASHAGRERAPHPSVNSN